MTIATIDFEASSLWAMGKPIEVGVALWKPGSSIRTWCSLICPRPEVFWSEDAALIHGITRLDLTAAPHPLKVAEQLNALMVHIPFAFCDGGINDEHWMDQLFEVAAIKPIFRLVSYDAMPGLELQAYSTRMRKFLKTTKPPHRAGDDAVRLMRAYAYAHNEAPDVMQI